MDGKPRKQFPSVDYIANNILTENHKLRQLTKRLRIKKAEELRRILMANIGLKRPQKALAEPPPNWEKVASSHPETPVFWGAW